MKKELLDILACPIDKHYPLELYVFETNQDVIVSGLLYCKECSRYYPIIDEIPIMLPDDLRNKNEDISFLQRWKEKIPEEIIKSGKPWSIEA